MSSSRQERPDGARCLRSRVRLSGLTALVVLSTPVVSLAGEGYAMAGIGGGSHALDSWQGIVYAPFGTLGGDGLLVRGWNKTYRFRYKTTLPTTTNATINALGFSLEGEVGWQLTFAGKGRAALFAGIVWRDHILSPQDPGSNLAKARLGASFAVDGEYGISRDFGVMANASFVTGFDQYWGQVRPFLNLGDGWKIGIDLAGFGGKNYDIARAGFFTTGYELPVKKWGRFFVGGEAGVRFSIRDQDITPYAGINVGFLF